MAPSSKARPATPASGSPMSVTRAVTVASSSCLTTSRRRNTGCWRCWAPRSTKCRPFPTATRISTRRSSQRLAASLANAIWANQFDNTANRQAHIETTGPEIWEQTAGRVDAFVASSGTGGTFAGVAEYLKSRRRSDPLRPGRSSRQQPLRVRSQRHAEGNRLGLDHRRHRHRPCHRESEGCAHR